MDFVRRVRDAANPRVIAGAIVGGTATFFGAPIVVAAIGFTASGITAGSLAASMMSILGGGATSAGGIVAVLQSVGAVGAVGNGAVAVGAGVGAAGGYVFGGNPTEDVPDDAPVEALHIAQPVANDNPVVNNLAVALV